MSSSIRRWRAGKSCSTRKASVRRYIYFRARAGGAVRVVGPAALTSSRPTRQDATAPTRRDANGTCPAKFQRRRRADLGPLWQLKKRRRALNAVFTRVELASPDPLVKNSTLQTYRPLAKLSRCCIITHKPERRPGGERPSRPNSFVFLQPTLLRICTLGLYVLLRVVKMTAWKQSMRARYLSKQRHTIHETH